MGKIYRYEHGCAESLESVLDAVRQTPGSTLILAPGVYEITSALARQTLEDVMSGALGENPEIAMFKPNFGYSRGFDLSGMKDVTVDAAGATLLVNGFMEPVTMMDCENVTLRGLTIDHLRKPYSKATIKRVDFDGDLAGSGVMTVEFGAAYPVSKGTPMPRLCIFDRSANRFSLYGEIKFDTQGRREVSPQVWQIPFKNLFSDVVGNELYAWHTFHSRPAILIENSKNTRLEDVTIHSQPGMGIVAHRCENLFFGRLRVIPSAGEHMSTNTDATHITSCRGNVEFSCCCFDGQGDDATNVHTYYHTIEKTASTKCRIRLDAPTGTHSQSPDFPAVGDTLELTDLASLAVVDTYVVLECHNIDNHCSDLVLSKPLPEDCGGLCFADADCLPTLHFHDCLCRSHLARGVLAKTKCVLVENNEFIDVVGTAINVMAEAHWREGVCSTQSAVIRRNRISFCGRTASIRQGDSAGITVSLSAEKPYAAVHKGVVISDNLIDCPDAPHGIYISNAKNPILERNSVISRGEPVLIEPFAKPDV